MYQWIYKILKPIIYCISLMLIASACWTYIYFGRVTVDQIIFNTGFGSDNSVLSEPVFVNPYAVYCILLPILVTVLFVAGDRYLSKILKTFLCPLLLTIGICSVSYECTIIDLLKQFSRNQHDYFAANYIDPKLRVFHAKQAKSLVLIYVESLNNAYSNKQLFNRDLLWGLNKYKNDGISFANFIQMKGTQWSSASLVATQCGVPLKLLGSVRYSQFTKSQGFLPKAKCLSDILFDVRYKNIFMAGSNLDTSGFRSFLKQHHFTEIYGKEYWLQHGFIDASMSSWGLYDDDLLAQAKMKLADLVGQGKLFNLTIFTVDTHGPYGYLSNTCIKKIDTDFTDIVECSANQVAEFIQFVKSNGWLDKLTIVIIGDHLAMKNPVYDRLAMTRDKSIFNLILSGNKLHSNTNHINHFDIFPTIMDSIGIKYSGHRLGLGYSAISPGMSIQPAKRFEEMNDEISNYSETYNQLW